MTNNIKVVLVVVAIILISGFLYLSKNTAPTLEPISQASIKGCYVARLVKDVYTLNIQSQKGGTFTSILSFKNFEKDSSSGTYIGTYKDGILLGDYSFNSEGVDSVIQVIFKKSGDTFIRGFGDMDSTGTHFYNFNNITFDSKQTFIFAEDCPV